MYNRNAIPMLRHTAEGSVGHPMRPDSAEQPEPDLDHVYLSQAMWFWEIFRGTPVCGYVVHLP